ncbi:MAG: tyrosine-type recombinase/integrase [Arcobacteraceae bacterium]
MGKNYKLSKYENANKDLLFWIKHYLNYRFLMMKKTNVGDNFDSSKISSMIVSDENDTIEKLDTAINEATKIGLKGMSVYKIACVGFYRYCTEYNFDSIKEIGNSSIRDYTTRVCSNMTESRKREIYSALIHLFNYIDENNIDENKKPYLFKIDTDVNGNKIKVPFKRTNKKVSNYLTQKQLSKLSQNVVIEEKKDDNKSDFEKARNILIVRLFIYSGIKTSELLSLQDEDFELLDSKIINLHIRGAGSSKRIVPIPRGKFIEYYNTYTRDKKKSRDGYFFYSPNDPNHKLNMQIVSDLVKKHFKLAKINVNGGATSIRNGYAIYLARSKFPIVKIQKLMGHSSLKTTKSLISIDSPELIKTADIFETLDKL